MVIRECWESTVIFSRIQIRVTSWWLLPELVTLPAPSPPLFPSLISLMVSVDGKHRPQKPQSLLRTGEWRTGKRETIYLSLYCHHQNDSCIKMSSCESYLKVSLTVRNKVTRLSTNHNPFEEKGEPKRNRAVALLLTSLMPYR